MLPFLMPAPIIWWLNHLPLIVWPFRFNWLNSKPFQGTLSFIPLFFCRHFVSHSVLSVLSSGNAPLTHSATLIQEHRTRGQPPMTLLYLCHRPVSAPYVHPVSKDRLVCAYAEATYPKQRSRPKPHLREKLTSLLTDLSRDLFVNPGRGRSNFDCPGFHKIN